MKHLIELCAFCLSLGKITLGSFSVRTALPAVKNLFTYAVDENFFFECHGASSDYSKLDALKGIWSRKLTPKNTKSVK
jgi:hypothetical protein